MSTANYGIVVTEQPTDSPIDGAQRRTIERAIVRSCWLLESKIALISQEFVVTQNQNPNLYVVVFDLTPVLIGILRDGGKGTS